MQPWNHQPYYVPPPHRRRASKAPLWALGGLCVLLAGALIGVGLVALTNDDSSAEALRTSSVSTTTAPAARDLTDAELAAQYGDAVYRVDADACAGYTSGGSAFAIDEHHLVTNMHVVANDPTPTIQSRDGRSLKAEVVGATFDPDVAVLEVAETLPHTLQFARASTLAEGQRIVALGYPVPEGDFAVTPGGVVSFQVRNGRRTAIRTDAAVDHGNSGGPVLTTHGEVVGVVTQLEAETTQLLGVAFSYESVGTVVNQAVDGNAANEVVSCAELDSYIDDFYDDYYEDTPSNTLPSYDVPSTTAPPPTAPPTTEPPCPSGAPTVVVTSVESQLDEDISYEGETYWNVTVRGTVRNDASAAVTTFGVSGSIDGASYGDFFADVSAESLAPGASVPWTATVSDVEGAQPGSARASFSGGWLWSDYNFAYCPSGI